MTDDLGATRRREFLGRGFSRRDLGKMAALLAAGSALPFYNEAALAQGLSAAGDITADTVKINANENPMGPCPEAVEAIGAIVKDGGRYNYQLTTEFIKTLAAVEGLQSSYVMPFAGSSDPLHRAVLAYCSPARSFVVADPGYEAGGRAAEFVGAKVVKVPLRKDFSHDPQAMCSVDPNAGLIYVCNPNNPTGSVTAKDDVEYIVANKPRGCVVLLDEAYIHLSKSAVPGSYLAAADKDVIILRTFSKLFGMAGLRAGAAMGRPDLIEKLKGYGAGALPVTGMVGATASLKAKGLVESRREAVAAIREDVIAWLAAKGYACVPTEANMFMVDVRKPGRDFARAMLKQKVAVGRNWEAMPHHVRVTVGTPAEMARFKAAFEAVMA